MSDLPEQNIYLFTDPWPAGGAADPYVKMRKPATLESIQEAFAQVTRKVDTNGRIIFTSPAIPMPSRTADQATNTFCSLAIRH